MLSLGLILSTPLVLAALGGFFSERSGVVNIALEGLMLTSACVVAVFSPHLGAIFGLGAGIASAVLLSLLHGLATQQYRIDHVVSGMAINLLAAGGTDYLYGQFGDSGSSSFPHLDTWFFVILAIILPFLTWLYVAKTRGGLHLVAVGNDPEKARLAGLSPVKTRVYSLLICGVLSGLAGGMLVSYTGVFTNDMTAGRGYIALAALVLSGWRPLQALGACLVFGFLNAAELQFQGQPVLGMMPPSQLWASLPYLATIVALAGFMGKSRTPAGLGRY